MTDDNQQLLEVFDRRVERRNERREFFRNAFGAAAIAGAGMAALSIGSRAGAQTAPTDVDVLNFALNLEYLEGQFYSHAVFGTGLDAALLTGPTGTTPGAVSGGRKVNFTDQVVQQYAIEIAADEVAHVKFLRTALGASAIAQPTIDIGVTPTSSFSNAARAAGLIGAGESFDVYASDENFLLGAFIFEDVGVTAYKGAAPLLTNKTYLEAAAGLLAVEAYHASILRTVLYTKGIPTGTTPTLRASADAISGARDSLDGSSDLDQGISSTGSGDAETSNIVPLDDNGIAFSRTTGQVLNVVYLNNLAVSKGGFFPAGVNGTITTSAAN